MQKSIDWYITSWEFILIAMLIGMLIFIIKTILKIHNKKNHIKKTFNANQNKTTNNGDKPGMLYVDSETYDMLKKEKLIHPKKK